MADSPLTSFAIGSLAASRGASDLAELSASLFRPRAAPQGAATVAVNAVLRAAQETDEYVQKLERYVEDLQREVRELRAHSAKVESDRDKMYAWADWAEAELRRRPKAE